MHKLLILLVLVLKTQLVLATTFTPVSIKTQIKESDGIIQGEVISIDSIEENNKIITRATILANKWIGVRPTEDLVDVYFPGGRVGNKVVKVHGAPKFEVGEKVVVFTKSRGEKDWVLNLGLGKFSMNIMGERTVMVNQIFPGHPHVGHMNFEKFSTLTEWVKNKKFKERFKDKYELNMEKEARMRLKNRNRGRVIASVEPSLDSQNKLPNFWLVIIFGALGIFYGVFRNRSS